MNLFASLHLAFIIATNLLSAAEFRTSSPDVCPTVCTCSADLSEINCANRGLTAIPANIPSVARALHLNDNQISAIPPRAFLNLTGLTELRLERNLIATLQNDSFQGLKSLKYIYLRQNGLTDRSVPREAFRHLTSLQRLNLENNQFSSIPDVSLATGLTILDLDSNLLTSVTFPEGFENLGRLNTIGIPNNNRFQRIARKDFQRLNRSAVRTINVAGCDLISIENGVFNFTHLQALVLSNNSALNETSLRNIFQGIGEMAKPEMQSLTLSGTIMNYEMKPDLFEYLSTVPLQTVQLDNSKLFRISRGTFDFFPKLNFLNLAKSQINEIADGTLSEKLGALQKLALRGNYLRSIPTMNLPNLTELDLSENKGITDIPNFAFSGATALKHLDLSRCGIESIHERSFVGLSNLMTLDLSGNALEKSNIRRSAFNELGSLVSLDMSRNPMRSMTSDKLFAPLRALQRLDLSGNECNNVSKGIFRSLKNLTSLNLRSNRLGDVINSGGGQYGGLFRGLDKLRNLSLKNNTISALPPGLFVDQINLMDLDLSVNSLTSWPVQFLSPNLDDRGNGTVVNLVSNKILTVEMSALMALPVGVRLDLSANPFVCGCDLIEFRRWISESNATAGRLIGLSAYRCYSPQPSRPLLAFNPDSIDQACRWRLVVRSVGCGVAASAALLAALVYRYRWPLRLRAYRLRRWMTGHGQSGGGDGGYRLDVVVSYGPSHEDGRWVKTVLIPAIDRRESNRIRQELERRRQETDRNGQDSDGLAALASIDGDLNEHTCLIARGVETEESTTPGDSYRVKHGIWGGANIEREPTMGRESAADGLAETAEFRVPSGAADADENVEENPRAMAGPGESGTARNSDDNDLETFNVFFEELDVLPNASVLDSIGKAMEGSRRTLLVVSQAYLDDARRRCEIQLAIDCCCERGWANLEGIIVVELDPGVVVQLPKPLHLLGERHRSLVWTEDDADGIELFWSKLREELRRPLPERMDRRENSVARGAGVPLLNGEPEEGVLVLDGGQK